jgi:aminoglycoside 6-adenylyltransferase
VKKSDEFYNKFEEAFISWAEKIDDIRAAFIVGSRARMDHPADKWSDLDIIMYANNYETYFSSIDWLENLGDIWVTFIYHTSSGEAERLTLFEGGFQVDIVFHSSNSLYQLVKDRITPDSFYRGVRVLIDKDNVSDFIVPMTFKLRSSSSINETAFTQAINMFLFGSLYVAKQILRGELWLAKTRENDLKTLLLQMMEWYAKTKYGKDYDVWHAGRFLDEWVDRETLEELKNTFGHYEKTDSFRALIATMNLFRRLSIEIAQKLKFRYPTVVDENITNWIKENANIEGI